MRKLFSLAPSVFVALLAVTALGFFVSFGIKPAQAAAGDIVVTVNDELGAALSGATVTIQCTEHGGTLISGLMTNGSGQVTVSQATASAAGCDENGDGFPGGTGDPDSFTVNVTKTGYVNRTQSFTDAWHDHIDPGANVTVTNVLFTYRIDTLTNELGTTIMPTSGTPWTASNGLSLAAQTYNSNKWYLALSGTGNLAFDLDGYVRANITASPSASSQTLSTIDFIDVEFAYKITGITSESLGADLTGSVTTLEVGDDTGRNTCFLSGGAWYCPVVLANSNGTLVARVAKDGYVEKNNYALVTGTTRSSGATLQISDTITGIQYGLKVTATQTSGGGALTGGTVVSGNGYTTACSENGSTGIYFCALPLADTEVSARVVKSGFLPGFKDYTDRTLATDAQSTVAISLDAGSVSSGGGGGGFVSGGASGYATTNTTNNTTNTSTSNQTPPAEATPDQTPAKPKDIVTRINEEKEMLAGKADAEAYFINTGTETTLKLGAGERGAAVSSFKEAYGVAPKTAAQWGDVLNMANGRWPITVNKTVEARAYVNFRATYGRNADMKNSTDVNALKMMGYGVRSSRARDLKAEASAIVMFRTTFGMAPTTARHWNIVRAMAYSGVTK